MSAIKKQSVPIAVSALEPEWFTPQQLCDRWQIHKRTLIRMYQGYRKRDGALQRPVIAILRRGRSVRISRYEVQRYEASRTTVAA